jgi:transposase
MSIVIGCDFHSRMQVLIEHDRESGVRREVRLEHADRGAVAAYYGALPADTVVLLETTAYTAWFTDLLAELKLEVIFGDAGKLAAMRVRRVKTDRRDAEHMVEVYLRGQFPRVVMAGPEQRDLRQLLLHRDRLVRTRTRCKNGLHLLAMSRGLNRKAGLFSGKGRQALCQLKLGHWESEARADLLLALDAFDLRIQELDAAVEAAVRADPAAERLRTHPGVGPVTALAWVQIMGDCQRFATSGQAASYLGLTPSEASSGGQRRLGAITKQGNKFLRWVLVEAAQGAARHEEGFRRRYQRLALRKHRATAKLAMARRLAERLYWMSRRGVGYPEVLQR